MTWGPQANGLAPTMTTHPAMAARGLRLQRTGSVDVVFDMNSLKPDLFWISWNTALDLLLKTKYRWQVVYGPLQALQLHAGL